jgi:hypothetical protein
MARCDTCGNDYERSFQVVSNGTTKTFDSFECAIEAMAPRCDHCNTRIIGHGLEAGSKYYCCRNCAEHEGVKGLRDHL